MPRLTHLGSFGKGRLCLELVNAFGIQDVSCIVIFVIIIIIVFCIFW